MKTFFLSFCLIASIIFLFTNCSKDDSAPATATDNYSPLTAGSTWTYNYTQSPSPTYAYTIAVTNNDTTISGKKYKVLTSSDNSGNKYLAKIDSNYYRFASFAQIGSFEELYLKDNREVNSTWTGTTTISYQGFPLVANLLYTVKEKGINSDANGKTYNNVMHIRLDISIGSFGNIGGGDFYYAKDIGLIKNTVSLSVEALNLSFASATELTSYQINK